MLLLFRDKVLCWKPHSLMFKVEYKACGCYETLRIKAIFLRASN